MIKTLLSLFFTGLACSFAWADMVMPMNILDIDGKVSISSKNQFGWIESPHITIINTADHCEVNANDFGFVDRLSLVPIRDSEGQVRAIQVVSAVFNGCRIYFGRVRTIGKELPEEQSVLLGIQSRDEKAFTVFYNGDSVAERLESLSRELLNDPSRSSLAEKKSDTSLVLLLRK